MNNYIQVNIGGKARGLKFNNAAVDTYWQKVNFQVAAEASSIYATFYAGLVGNDIAKGVQETELDYETVTEWVDELFLQDEAVIRTVCDMFSETAYYKKRFESIQEKVRALSNEQEVKPDKKKARKPA